MVKAAVDEELESIKIQYGEASFDHCFAVWFGL